MTWLGLIAVGLTAIVWSFTALSDLARLCGVTAVIELPPAIGLGGPPVRLHVAWGLPITVDVLALVATRVWLRGQAPDDAVRYARRAAWGAILATIAGNAYHGWLTGQGRLDAIIVSAAPAVVIGVIVHLAVLAGRPHRGEDEQPPADRPAPPEVAEVIEEEPDSEDLGEWTAVDELARLRAGGGSGDPEADARETRRLEYLVRRGLPDRKPHVRTEDPSAVAADLRAGYGRTTSPDQPVPRCSRDDICEMYAIGKGKADPIYRALAWRGRDQADDRADAGGTTSRR